jgi:DNA invertase Pin-like site-specific DNA recombinase
VSDPKFPRALIRRLEAEEQFPLHALDAIRELRGYLDRLEEDALRRARDLGASIVEIADTMGKTRQAVYNRLKQLDEKDRGEVEPVVVPELETKPHR